SGQTAALPTLAIQYADFTAWDRARLDAERAETELAYWRTQLHSAPSVLEIPTDRPRPAVRRYRGARIPVFFSSEVRRAVEKLSRDHGTTLFMTLLGAFQVLLARHQGAGGDGLSDVVVGSPVANRTHREVEPLIGFLANTLAFRTDLSGDPTFAALL